MEYQSYIFYILLFLAVLLLIFSSLISKELKDLPNDSKSVQANKFIYTFGIILLCGCVVTLLLDGNCNIVGYLEHRTYFFMLVVLGILLLSVSIYGLTDDKLKDTGALKYFVLCLSISGLFLGGCLYELYEILKEKGAFKNLFKRRQVLKKEGPIKPSQGPASLCKYKADKDVVVEQNNKKSTCLDPIDNKFSVYQVKWILNNDKGLIDINEWQKLTKELIPEPAQRDEKYAKVKYFEPNIPKSKIAQEVLKVYTGKPPEDIKKMLKEQFNISPDELSNELISLYSKSQSQSQSRQPVTQQLFKQQPPFTGGFTLTQ